jgi:hypothetical protein
MDESEFKLDDATTERDLLFRIVRELTTLRQQVNKALFAMSSAEKEVPEYMRRFANYFHDIVHIKGEYVTLGIPPPRWLDEEMERCHDRMKQALHDLHTDGGAFEKVRREMASHPMGNRYDHTRQLAGPTKGVT